MRWFKRAPRPEPDADFLDLLSDHGLAAFERQAIFTDTVGDRDWQLDQDQGVLRFGDDLSFPVQIIGSESDRSRTWLWAWANASVEEALTVKADASRASGVERSIGVLSEPEIDLHRMGEAYLLALATAGLLQADAYYPCPYPGGAAYVLVEAPSEAQTRTAGERSALVVAGAVDQSPVLVSRKSMERYLADIGAEVSSTPEAIRVGDAATFRFDELGRLIELAATLDGPR
jgi:hypothetical protein